MLHDECFFNWNAKYTTNVSESMNNAMKGHLKSDIDIIRFLKRVEHVVQDKRERMMYNLNLNLERNNQGLG